jgi:hypothetical protein
VIEINIIENIYIFGYGRGKRFFSFVEKSGNED